MAYTIGDFLFMLGNRNFGRVFGTVHVNVCFRKLCVSEVLESKFHIKKNENGRFQNCFSFFNFSDKQEFNITSWHGSC